MARRNLLLCFDAFGTLFHSRQPVAEQYAAVARECGLNSVKTQEIQQSFKVTFSEESKAHPNYGKAVGMGADKWWTSVIHKTFQPLVGPGIELPEQLASRLLHRFSSSEGYALQDGVVKLLRSLKRGRLQHRYARVTVGVITNSDDRVPSILSSLGLLVSPLRFGAPFDAAKVAGQQYDIDLHCMSYDVGYAKPDRRIFDAAAELANRLPAVQGSALSKQGKSDSGHWLKMYVGDDYEKDVVGAREAGWNPVFVGAKGSVPGESDFLDVELMGNLTPEDILLQEGGARTIRAESTQGFLKWLMDPYSEAETQSFGSKAQA